MSFAALLLSLAVSWAAPSQGPAFTDANFEAILHLKNEKTILYTWSPHMNLSVKGLDEIIRYSRYYKYHLVVVLDPDCNLQDARKIAGKHQWPAEYLLPMRSHQLIAKGLRIHYPTYLLIEHGEFASPVTPGYKSQGELDRITRTYFK